MTTKVDRCRLLLSERDVGLFDWVKPKKPSGGPTPAGLYGDIPKGAQWTLGPDPAGSPKDFLPDAASYIFDIAEWKWDKTLAIEAVAKTDGTLAGFGLVLGLSDGEKTDSVELWQHHEREGPILKERQEWTIPRGHPTREMALVSSGERTTHVLRRLEQCFGYKTHSHPALPEKTAVMCELLMLRGIVKPDVGRFTARTKVVLHEYNGWPYAEFFLNINSFSRQIWLSEKSDDYRAAILTRISDHGTAQP